jgi:Co/Zn/Cd efflux system component
VTLAVIIAAVVLSLALCWRNSHRDAGMTRLEALSIRMKIILLVLAVCGLCSKAVVHTYRHFNPPPPPIVGP